MLALGAGSPALADTITFKNGHEVHGRLVEETPDSVIFQVGNGRLKFQKKDIATFTEDADYGQRYFILPKRSEESQGEATQGRRRWVEHKDATGEEKKDLRGVHARILEEMAKLGPSPEDRQRALELSGLERASLDAALASLGKGRGSSDIAGLGLKAVGPLSEALLSGDSASKSDAATALADVVTRGDPEDAKWLLGKNKVGTRLAAVLESAGEPASAAARNAANRALEQISGTSFSWPESKEPSPTEAQRTAIGKWKDWVQKDAAAFDSGEKSRADARKKLENAWRALDDAKGWRKALADAVDVYGVTPSGGSTGGAKPEKGDKAPSPASPDIAKDATPEEQRKLAEVKARVKAALEKVVGPSADERKKAYELSNEERQALDATVASLGRSGKRGNRGDKRQNAANELIAMGLKAAGVLAEVLGNADNVYARWSAAGALGALSKTGDKTDVRILYDALDVPSKLVALLDEATDERAAFIRADANKALEAVSGQSVGWPTDVTEPVTTKAESDCKARWRDWAAKEASDFRRVEKLREEHRKVLAELQKKLDGARSWREALAAAPKAVDKAEKDLGK